ncbi:Teichoic acid translocation permease protein TagG [Rosistilla carotiformis]|uniref:Teichoic acid translocation permease protein TagG n=1 Tax=Rosistilla carotiformis TaxID=2528017 RepID=A0A518JVI3_9BACT|nr:ABC transporter permease [Rosistilla carotiformis]QDV69545.1 Teichoic acid translocation permease protein TagG [Rosistilla carotiformis]
MNDPRPVLRERVITPHGGFDAFTDAIAAMISDIPQSRALAWRMFLRDTRAMYRQSLLGYFWILLPPLATAAIWIFLNNEQLVSIDTGNAPVPIFVLTGTVLWTAFNMSVVGMQAIMAEARSVLSKVNFPHEALVLSGIGKALLNTMIPALVLIPALPAYGIAFSWSMLLFPLGFLTLVVFGCALGLILVPLSALYMDIGRAVQLGLRFGFFATPVIYALPASGSTHNLLLLNPITAPLVSSRYWLIGSESSFGLLTGITLLLSFLSLVAATVVFKVTMPHIIERMNA